MKKDVRDLLDDWPRNFIRDADLAQLCNKTGDARHSLVSRLLKADRLRSLRRGLYVITSHVKRQLPHPYEFAQQIYEPSIISVESALSHHGWIPEAVYTHTSVTPRRGREFTTYLGIFSFEHVPAEHFYLGTMRYPSPTGICIIAEPWRALADFMYVKHKSWPDLAHLELDLRVDIETALTGDTALLKILCADYPSPRVRKGLRIFLQEITKKNGATS